MINGAVNKQLNVDALTRQFKQIGQGLSFSIIY